MDKDYINILRKSMDDCIKGAYEEAYEKGLNDAWECAKKISLAKTDGGLSVTELNEIFSKSFVYILKDCTPSEAIAKIKEYEEKQKQTDNCPKKKQDGLSSDCDRFEPKPCNHEWSESSRLFDGRWNNCELGEGANLFQFCKKCGIVRVVLNKEGEQE